MKCALGRKTNACTLPDAGTETRELFSWIACHATQRRVQSPVTTARWRCLITSQPRIQTCQPGDAELRETLLVVV